MNKGNLLKRAAEGSIGPLIFAQLLVLAALCLGLQFIVRTTGGSLFLAASLAPVLTVAAILVGGGILMYRWSRSHSLFNTEEFEAGEVVFRVGDSSECAYFIKAGQVDIVREEARGEVLIATLSEGEYFGEMALLSDSPRNATARARTRTVAEVIGKQNFLSMVRAVRGAREDVMKTVEKRTVRGAGASGS